MHIEWELGSLGKTNLGAIREFVGCEIDLAKGTLPYKLP